MSITAHILEVHHTALNVRDFDGMRGFLVEFLGFEVEAEANRRNEALLGTVVGLPGATIRWALLCLGSHRIELFSYLQPEGRADPPAQCDVAFTHLAFEVDDVAAVHAEALASGYVPLSVPQTLREGGAAVFYLRGPESIIFEFMQFPDKEVR